MNVTRQTLHINNWLQASVIYILNIKSTSVAKGKKWFTFVSDGALKGCFGLSLLHIYLISQVYSAMVFQMGQLKMNIWIPLNLVHRSAFHWVERGNKDTLILLGPLAQYVLWKYKAVFHNSNNVSFTLMIYAVFATLNWIRGRERMVFLMENSPAKQKTFLLCSLRRQKSSKLAFFFLS